jgi:hypothetical protein
MTVFVYAVRCNFALPEREAAWNEWYSGPKLREMLEKPLFLSVQRFAAVALDRRRKYLALWLVASPDAFTTPEYRADWGFFEWTRHITDWSRDLYASPFAADDPVFVIGPDEALYIAAFDGMSEAAARQRRDAVAQRLPGVAWLEAVALDRHAPILGLRKIARRPPPAPLADAPELRETVFAPISERFRLRDA